MKRTTAILLFFALTFPFWGSLVVLHIQKQKVKREIKWSIAEGLPKSDLTLLVFNAEEVDTKVKWKHSKEFEFDGEMYDVVQKEERDDSIHYWCWWDKKETHLNRKIDKLAFLALNGHENSKNQKTHFFKFLKLMDLPPKKSAVTFTSGTFSSSEANSIFLTISRSISPDTPPPKC